VTRVTALGLSIVTIAAWSLVLGVLTGRAELVLVAIPLLLGVLRATRVAVPADCALAHEVSSTRVFEGDRLQVTVTISAARPLPLVELFEPVPSTARVASGGNRSLLTLPTDAPATWTYEIDCVRRGPLSLGTVHARVWDRLGLRAHEVVLRAPKLIRVYPRPFPVRRLPRPRRTQTSIGNYVARSVGEGLEPGDIRPFQPGDRVRHVNWRASLRWQRLYVTQYQQERNADVVLMLDSLSKFGDGHETTLDISVRAVASLAAAYLERKDRVGFIEYGGFFRSVRPGTGRLQYERVLDALFRADVAFSYVTRDIALVPRRVLPAQALVIVVSPLLDVRFEKAVIDLAARGFDIVIVSPSPVSLARRAAPMSPTVDLACRLWTLERHDRADALRRLGLAVVDWDPVQPLDVALDGLARHRRQRATVR
jgi:uncharacterized protein (DUF58 family)